MIESIGLLLEAEVVAAYPPSSPKNRGKLRWEYDLLYRNECGFLSTAKNAVRLESFSGYTNYSEMVVEATGDYDPESAIHTSYGHLDKTFTKGARCVVGFIGGLSIAPVIIGFLPHTYNLPTIKENVRPSEGDGKSEIEDNKVHPVMDIGFNGIQMSISEVGDFILAHHGKTVTKQDTIYKAPTHTKPKKERFSFLKLGYYGEFTYNNANSQVFTLDPKSKILDWRDTANQIRMMSESGKENILIRTAGKFFEHSKLDKQRTCDGSETIEIKKDLLQEVDGKITINCKKEYSLTAKTKILSKSDNIVIDGKKIAIGSGSVELFDTLVTIMEKVIENGELIVNTTAGPGQLNPVVKQIIQKAKSDLDSIKGSL